MNRTDAVLDDGQELQTVRLVTASAALGLVFMGAIVVPVYLVPALAIVLAAGIAAESHPNWPTALRVPRRRARQDIYHPGRDAGLQASLISPDDEL